MQKDIESALRELKERGLLEYGETILLDLIAELLPVDDTYPETLLRLRDEIESLGFLTALAIKQKKSGIYLLLVEEMVDHIENFCQNWKKISSDISNLKIQEEDKKKYLGEIIQLSFKK